MPAVITSKRPALQAGDERAELGQHAVHLGDAEALEDGAGDLDGLAGQGAVGLA
jgi:hypothetical protein